MSSASDPGSWLPDPMFSSTTAELLKVLNYKELPAVYIEGEGG